MTQPHGNMEKKTIKQLLEMPKEELKAYLLSIPIEERKPINKELLKAIYDQIVQKIVEDVDR
jgi:hypothetical protein